ncbi:hypothetical protein ACFY5J_00110 [Peribacillus butanolivorans]
MAVIYASFANEPIKNQMLSVAPFDWVIPPIVNRTNATQGF